MVIEYDLRQVNLLKKQIEFYQNGKMSLGELIDRVDSLISVMENVDINWKNAIWENWMDLESVYAGLLMEEKEREYSQLEIEIISKALVNIFTLTDALLKENSNEEYE